MKIYKHMIKSYENIMSLLICCVSKDLDGDY